MPDTNRLPRIGEIWEHTTTGERVLVLHADEGLVDIYTGILTVHTRLYEGFTAHYKPVGEYDLDPLVLALKGDRT